MTGKRLGRHLVIMGVAGAGKTTLGRALADRLGVSYLDADELHPKSNIEKMSTGVALSDADRKPWLKRVGAALAGSDEPMITGCSALKRSYRDMLLETAGRRITFIYLSVSGAEVTARLSAREKHFFDPALCRSQFVELEPPGSDEDAITVDGDQSVEEIVAEVIKRL